APSGLDRDGSHTASAQRSPGRHGWSSLHESPTPAPSGTVGAPAAPPPPAWPGAPASPPPCPPTPDAPPMPAAPPVALAPVPPVPASRSGTKSPTPGPSSEHAATPASENSSTVDLRKDLMFHLPGRTSTARAGALDTG